MSKMDFRFYFYQEQIPAFPLYSEREVIARLFRFALFGVSLVPFIFLKRWGTLMYP